MNNLLSTIALFLLTTVACFAQETVTLKVTVPNAGNDTGKMMIGVYEKDTFMKAAPLHSANVTIVEGVATYIFENVKPGEYAVSVLHDKNENGRMDFDGNFPSEPYGMSNNPMTMGPPSWEDAKFTLSENKEVIVRL